MEQIAPDVDPNMLYIGPRPFFILVLIQDIMHVMQFLFGIHINIYLQYRTVSTYLLYVPYLLIRGNFFQGQVDEETFNWSGCGWPEVTNIKETGARDLTL